MNYAMQLDLDLSALPLDEFEVVDQDLAVDSLTAGPQASTGAAGCCHYCACPCVCCV
jgi:hypothetical protein